VRDTPQDAGVPRWIDRAGADVEANRAPLPVAQQDVVGGGRPREQEGGQPRQDGDGGAEPDASIVGATGRRPGEAAVKALS
jgi:hypothetical protein